MTSTADPPARLAAPLRAVVTGASSGIGAATVRALRAEGWDVVAVARRADRLEAIAQETGASAMAADVTSDDDVARLVREVVASGPVHALVNIAGGALGADPVAQGSVAEWQAMFDVNVLGTLRMTQAFLPALRASGRGDVVLLTSTAAHGTYPGGGGYVAAKHAERQIATTLRLELVGEPIRVIEIAPGMVHTEEFSLTRFPRGPGGRRCGLPRGRRASARAGRRRRRGVDADPTAPRQRGHPRPAPARAGVEHPGRPPRLTAYPTSRSDRGVRRPDPSETWGSGAEAGGTGLGWWDRSYRGRE